MKKYQVFRQEKVNQYLEIFKQFKEFATNLYKPDHNNLNRINKQADLIFNSLNSTEIEKIIEVISKLNHIPNKCKLFDGKTCLNQFDRPFATENLKNLCKDCKIYMANCMVIPTRC